MPRSLVPNIHRMAGDASHVDVASTGDTIAKNELLTKRAIQYALAMLRKRGQIEDDAGHLDGEWSAEDRTICFLAADGTRRNVIAKRYRDQIGPIKESRS